jgi:hypothetical protein
MVKVLRTFRDGPSGRIVHPGDEVDPTPARHNELALQGLVEPPGTGAKTAPNPANKMAPAPADKAITVTAPAEVPKRKIGRPAGTKTTRKR